MSATNNLSAPVFKHLGAIYEQCVDLRLNLKDIQTHLGVKGIHKPMLAIKHDLDNVFCFDGYAERHPAPAPLDVLAFDKAVDRLTGSEKAWPKYVN